MRSKRRSISQLLPIMAAIPALLLTACGPAKPAPTPTMSVDAIYTSAFQTLTSQQATQQASTPPTATQSQTPFPTLAPAPSLAPNSAFGSPTAAIGGGGQGCDSSVYVNDVTIPDGTVIDAGKKFTKTWTIMNNGTCTWNSSYKLALVGGDAMGGTSVPVPNSVPAGTQAQLSVDLTAPTSDGSYTGSWELQNAAGQPFGNIITVVIKVGTSSTTNTPGTAAPTSSTPATATTP